MRERVRGSVAQASQGSRRVRARAAQSLPDPQRGLSRLPDAGDGIGSKGKGNLEVNDRPLPHPDEPIFDQGLAFDLETLLDRRRMLTLLGIGGLGLALAACSTTTTTTSSAAASTAAASTGEACATDIPEETAGPFPGDGSNGPDVLSQSGIVRRDIRSSFGDLSGTAEGVPLEIQLNLQDATGCEPLAGAAVYAWHCDREGALLAVHDHRPELPARRAGGR